MFEPPHERTHEYWREHTGRRAHRQFRFTSVCGKRAANALRDKLGRLYPRLWQEQRKLISTETCCCIDVSASHTENIGQPTQRSVSCHVTVAVIYLFQSIQVEE